MPGVEWSRAEWAGQAKKGRGRVMAMYSTPWRLAHSLELGTEPGTAADLGPGLGLGRERGPELEVEL